LDSHNRSIHYADVLHCIVTGSLRNEERDQAIKDQEYEKAMEKEKRRKEYLERKERKRKVREKRHAGARAKFFLAEVEDERQRYITKHRERITKEDESTFFKKRTFSRLEDYFPPPNTSRRSTGFGEDGEQRKKRSRKSKPKIYEHIFRKTSTKVDVNQDDSFKDIREKFGLPNSHVFDKFKPTVDPVISKYLPGNEVM